ncbi:MAG TPA: Ig-like domain repeat protein, partial [Candidatus Sulfopaludibacter sp.]|nr:Ig-like domain repeat protein [Candidatus Sulfopaludibacter sp.]
STAQISPGLHYISAVYQGDGNWTAATSSFVPENVTLAQTNTQISSSVNPSVYGQAVTFTVAVGVAFPGTVPASGQVQLYDNTAAVGSAVSVSNGQASVTLTNLAPGTHNIIAQYVGNPSFATSSSGSITQTVNKAPTVTTLAAVPGTSSSSQSVSLTAVVSVSSPGAGTPTGTVQFMDTTSNTVLATAPLTVVGGVFTATATTNQLNQSGAPRLLTATYSGDANFAGSTSPAQPQTVSGTSIAVTNAAGYTGSNFSPDGAAAIFVSGLVNTTLVANTLPLPQSLGGVTVTVTDSQGVPRQAALYFISPNQINFLMPTNTAFGLATIVVTNASGATASGIVLVTHTAPGIFTANQSGQGVAQAQVLDVNPSGQQTTSNTAMYDPTSGLWVASPIAMNSTDSYFLVLYGTGIRYAAANSVTAMVNGVSVPVQYAGAQPQFPGLDQVNIGPLPASLKGAGSVNVAVAVAGQAANTVTVTFQ